MKKIYVSLIFVCLSCQINYAQSLFCDDFENGINGWVATSASGSVWQQDTFSIGSMPNHIWDIGLYSNYPPNTNAFLYTPVFNIPAPLNLSLCFWHQFDTETYQDGTRLDYSVDGGLTWQVLGTGGSVNWYNAYFITSSGNLPGWTGFNPVWINAYYFLGTVPSATLQFRFVFTSDSLNSSGYHIIDNFCLCNNASCNSTPLGIEETIFSINSISISPNPAFSEIQISDFNFQKGDEIIFSDITGKICFTKRIQSLTSELRLQTSDLNNGIYFLEVKTQEGVLNKKVVVQH